MELQKLYVTLAMELKQYADGLDDAVGRARSFGDRIRGALGGAVQTAGLAAAAGLTAVTGAAVGLAASSVGVATEFQSSMAIMSTAVDPVSLGVETTAEAMGLMSDAALRVGSDTDLVGVSASTSAEAITGLYKAGLSTNEIFGDLQGYLGGTADLGGALRASIDLAAASELDMVGASELAAITLATFGGHLETEAERAEFINGAMNNFVQTADASVASVGDLQAAFVNIGPTAAAMGMGVEDVNTALGILSTRGIVGSEAGTALKSMLVNLQRTTPAVTSTLEDLGVSLYDAQGVMYELPEIIGQLETSMAGMTDEQRQQTIVTLAGSYGMNAMNALLGEGTAGWAAMEEAVSGAATMQETAAARTDTLAGAQEALSGVWESFQIKVGTALIPVLTALADIGGALIDKYGPVLVTVFENVGAGIGRIIEVVSGGQLGELFTVFEDGSSVLGSIFESFGMGEEAATRLATGISGIVTTVQNALGPIVAAVTQFVSWKDVLVGLGIAVGSVVIPAIVAAVAPIALVIGGVIGVVALLRNAWEQDWGGIQEKVAAVVAFITPIFETIKGVIQGLMANLSEGMSPLDAFIEAIWGIVPQPVLDALVNLRDNVLPGLSATFQTVWGLIQTVVNAALGVIRPALEALMSNARDAAGGLANLTGPLKELWEKVGPLIRAAATVVGGILTALVGVVVGVVRGIANAVGPLIETFVNVAENVIEIVGGIIDFLTGFFDLLVGLFTGNGEKVKAAFAKMGEGVEQIVGGLVEGVWNLFSGLVETVATLIDGFISGIVEFFQNLYDELVGHSIVVDLVETVVQWFEDLVTWIGDALEALWEAVSQPFIEMWGELTAWFAEKVAEAIELGKSIIGGIVQGLQAVGHMITQTIMNFMQAAWDRITSFWEIGSPSKRMEDAGENVGSSFAGGIDAARPAAVESMAKLGVQVGEALVASLTDPLERAAGLMEMLGSVSGLGGGFARVFEQRTLEPMREQLDSFTSALEGMGEQLGLGAEAWLDAMTPLRLLRMANDMTLGQQERDTARTMLAFMEERGALNAEYIEQQERLAEIQERQADVAFLQQQFELLKLIRDNGLDTGLLEGLTFGLDADAGALMDAMSAAMQAMIQAAEDELGIHSPSRWAIDTMQNLFGTMTRTAEQEAASLRQTLGRALEPALGAVSQETGGGSVDNSRRATNYGGIHYHVQGNGASPLEALWEMA